MSIEMDTPMLAGRYELGTVLGHGGVGSVYLARDVVLERAVAVKLFRSDAAVPDLAGRYEQEARLLASLSHPGLVTIFDAGLDTSVAAQPQPFLVMELVEGPTLAHRLAEGPLPATQVAALGAELAAALGYVHRRGVVHRDVKPANILLADGVDGAPATAKLTDFGIARLVDSTRMTMHGLTLGTANYLSPEQAIGGEVGAPTDVYALGLVLLECCTGQIVYPGHGVEAAVVRLHRPPEFPPWLGPQWTHLLVAMTHPDPAQRPSAAESSAALSLIAQAPDAPGASVAALASAPTQALPVPTGGASTMLLASTPVPRPARWPWVAAAVVAGALVVVVALIATHHTPAPAAVRPPAYPSVSGQLGTDLQQLQKQVQAAGSDTATRQLQADALAVTKSAAARADAAAQANLDKLTRDLAAARSAGTVSAARAVSIQAAIAVVSADIAAASARSTTPSAPAKTTAPAKSTHPAPSPTKHKKHGGGGG